MEKTKSNRNLTQPNNLTVFLLLIYLNVKTLLFLNVAIVSMKDIQE